MKVLLINGSPNTKGCTYTALKEIENELIKENIETEIIHIGDKVIPGCNACRGCNNGNRCVVDDIVNEVSSKAEEADGFFFGSPVYFASANGTMLSFMDRLFYSNSTAFAYKPGAAIVSARRGGTTAAYDTLNKYIGISNMISVPSQYWNMVHGHNPENVLEDEEGLQIMRNLGRNMAWLLKLLELGKTNNLPLPKQEKRIKTNFVRLK